MGGDRRARGSGVGRMVCGLLIGWRGRRGEGGVGVLRGRGRGVGAGAVGEVVSGGSGGTCG